MRIFVVTLLMILTFSLNTQAQKCSPIEVQKIGSIADHKQPIHLLFNAENLYDETKPYEQTIEDDDGFLRFYLVWALLAQGEFDALEAGSIKQSLDVLIKRQLLKFEIYIDDYKKNKTMRMGNDGVLDSYNEKIAKLEYLSKRLISIRNEHELMGLTVEIGQYVNTYKNDHFYKIPHYILGMVSFYSTNTRVSKIFKNTEFTDKPLLLSEIEHIPCVKASNEKVAHNLLDDVLSTETVFAETE